MMFVNRARTATCDCGVPLEEILDERNGRIGNVASGSKQHNQLQQNAHQLAMLAGMRQVVRKNPLVVGGGALLYLGSMYLAAVYLNTTQSGDEATDGEVLLDPCCQQGLAPLPKGVVSRKSMAARRLGGAARNIEIQDLSVDKSSSAKQVSTGGKTHRKFSEIARMYDDMISTEEFISFISFLRSSLIPIAKGATLEVSAGTGRTVGEYRFDKRPPVPGEFRREGVRKLVLLDASGQMLAQAAGKLAKLGGGSDDAAKEAIERAESAASQATEGVPARIWRGEVNKVPAELVVADAMALPFEDSSFDTVVDSFGLCSVDDPVLALNEMARVCKPGGQVLLIEHGRSEWDWLNQALDASAQGHRRAWGCFYNRDISKALARADLELKDHSRWNFWTTHIVRATPKKRKTVDGGKGSAASSSAVDVASASATEGRR